MVRFGVQISFMYENVPKICNENAHQALCRKQMTRVEHERHIHVTVHRNKFLFNKTNRRTNYSNLFCYKTLHVSGIFSAHRQVFSTVHSALVIFMQV